MHKLSGLSSTEIYFLQVWRLEVQDQGASTAAFWRESTLDCRLPDSCCILMMGEKQASSLASSYVDANHIDEGSALMI